MLDHASKRNEVQLAIQALHQLPDHCAENLDDLAERIGTDKLEMIQWGRADITFAYLVASKLPK